MIAIYDKATARTFKGPCRERHFLSMAAFAAILACVGWIHGDKSTSGPFCLDVQLLEKSRPRSVHNASCQTVVVNHAVHVQVFDYDGTKLVNEFSGPLVGKIPSFVSDAFVNPSHDFPPFCSFRCAFCGLCQTTLGFSQGFLFDFGKARIVDFLSSGQEGEGVKANIYSSCLFVLWQRSRFFAFATEADKPLASRRLGDSGCLEGSFQRTMQDNLDSADLADFQFAILQSASARGELREGHAVVSTSTLEAWVAWFFAYFATSEEGLKGKVNSGGYVLKGLGVHVFQPGELFFKVWNRSHLLVDSDALFFFFPSGFSLLQEVVVEPATCSDLLTEQLVLLFGGVKTVFESLTHFQENNIKKLGILRIFSKWLKPENSRPRRVLGPG